MEYNKENLDGWAIPREAFEWIYENLPHGSTILELGSGNGTKELGKEVLKIKGWWKEMMILL